MEGSKDFSQNKSPEKEKTPQGTHLLTALLHLTLWQCGNLPNGSNWKQSIRALPNYNLLFQTQRFPKELFSDSNVFKRQSSAVGIRMCLIVSKAQRTFYAKNQNISNKAILVQKFAKFLQAQIILSPYSIHVRETLGRIPMNQTQSFITIGQFYKIKKQVKYMMIWSKCHYDCKKM